MAKTKISEFSSTPANNTDIDSINIAEGCSPSGINDAIRELMSQLKDWQSGTSNDPYVVGSSGSLTLNQGTANGIPYLNGSKVVTSGTALTWDGSTFYVKPSNTQFVVGSSFAKIENLGGASASLIMADTTDSGTIKNVASSIAFVNSATEGMRLTTTGLGIGTTSPSTKLHVVQTTDANTDGIRVARSGNGTQYGVLSNYGGATWLTAVDTASGGNNILVFNRSSNGSTFTESARIDSSGNLLVGKTTNNDTSTGCVIIPSDGNTGRYKTTGDGGATGASFQVTKTDGNNTFLVRPNGNVTNTNNSYGAISDAKLKENIVDATPKLAGLMQVKVRNYNLIGSDKKQLGVVAQELEQVFPAMVDESFDMDSDGNNLSTTTKSVKYSVFVPMLIKAIQEQQAIIESLKARLDAANL